MGHLCDMCVMSVCCRSCLQFPQWRVMFFCSSCLRMMIRQQKAVWHTSKHPCEETGRCEQMYLSWQLTGLTGLTKIHRFRYTVGVYLNDDCSVWCAAHRSIPTEPGAGEWEETEGSWSCWYLEGNSEIESFEEVLRAVCLCLCGRVQRKLRAWPWSMSASLTAGLHHKHPAAHTQMCRRERSQWRTRTDLTHGWMSPHFGAAALVSEHDFCANYCSENCSESQPHLEEVENRQVQAAPAGSVFFLLASVLRLWWIFPAQMAFAMSNIHIV